MARVCGLDFAAIFALAEAMDASTPLLADVLPMIEPVIVAALQPEDEDGK